MADGDCAEVAPATGHPRLWLTEDDLEPVRAAAVDDNPIYKRGLRAVALEAREEMDHGELADDTGTPYWDEYPNENYAHLFALTDRSRYWGSAFALTVDWIYPHLSDDDKAAIRTVFLRWSAENEVAETTTLNHPEPVGIYNDPVLVESTAAVRFAGNNYYTAHMRNLGLMAMALDPSDDPGGELAAYLQTATGAYLYVFDHLTRTDSAGGQLAEGFEYSPQTAAYAVQLLLALRTANQDDTAEHGPEVDLAANPFYEDSVLAFVHSMSPVPIDHPDLGQVHRSATFCDVQDHFAQDPIEMLGPIGIHAAANATQSSPRWSGGYRFTSSRVARTNYSIGSTIRPRVLPRRSSTSCCSHLELRSPTMCGPTTHRACSPLEAVEYWREPTGLPMPHGSSIPFHGWASTTNRLKPTASSTTETANGSRGTAPDTGS